MHDLNPGEFKILVSVNKDTKYSTKKKISKLVNNMTKEITVLMEDS